MCSKKEELNSDVFKSEQKIVAQACGVSHMTVWRICIEGKNSSVGSDEEMQFKSPRKFHKCTKKCSEVDDFNAEVVRRIMHKFYLRKEYPATFSKLSKIKKKYHIIKVRLV